MICKLCQSKEVIKNSHIIPQFFSEWIKQGWPSGGLRNANEPDRRQEDTSKIPLLCTDCENRLSGWETKFANQVFYPFSKSGDHKFEYTDWLLLFSISLSWRIGTTQLHDLQKRSHHLSVYLKEALTIWGDYLLGRRVEPPPHEHHLFFDSLAHCVEFVGAYYDGRYALWTIDCFIATAKNEEVAIYSKLPGMTLFASVLPPQPQGWKNTRILESGTITTSEQEVSSPLLWYCMQDSARQVHLSMNSMSERQRRKVQERHEARLPEWNKKRRLARKKDGYE